MKIYNWIDSLFDTKEKRRTCLKIIVLIYVLWQNIWQSLLFCRMVLLKSYQDLFAFLPQMKGYTSSYFIRAIYEILARGKVSVFIVMQSLCEIISPIDITVFVLVVLLFISSIQKRKWNLYFWMQISIYIWTIGCIIFGFMAPSLQAVIHVVRTMSIGAIILEIICIYSVFLYLSKSVAKMVFHINVHES